MGKNIKTNDNLTYFVSESTKLKLVSLLIILNLIIRIPSIPHENGYDSFFIHSLSNSISNFGEARWWTNWLSVFGLYPLSYSSAVPFSLSGISQLSGISMEITILLYCVFLGVISISFSYLLASVFHEDFISRLIFSFIFSLSAGTMKLTTWEITTRAQFLVFFPFCIYLVFKFLDNKKFILLWLLALIFMFATHHFAYFLLFFSVLIILIALLLKNKHLTNIQILSSNIKKNYLYLMLLFLLFFIPFIFPSKVGLIESGSRYQWIKDMLIISGRSLGFLFPFTIGGIFFLGLKNRKNFEEWAILSCILPTIIFSYNKTYGYIITYLLFAIVAGEALINMVIKSKVEKRFTLFFVSFIFILNVCFSCFFVHWHLGVGGGGQEEWYMRHESFISGQWIQKSLNPESRVVPLGMEMYRMQASYGGMPRAFTDDNNNYVNGFITLNKSKILNNSMFSSAFYFDAPYVLQSGQSSSGDLDWTSQFSITDPRAKWFVNKFNITFFFVDSYGHSELIFSLPKNKNRIYNSGRVEIWEV